MKFLPRYIRCFVRMSEGEPRFAQDRCTFILIGRWVHLHNVYTGNWFFVSETMPLVKGLPEYLRREGTKLDSVSLSFFRQKTGKRATLEIVEDLVGLRATRVAQILCKLPFVNRWAWLERLSKLDELQDWSRWSEFEPPKTLPVEQIP